MNHSLATEIADLLSRVDKGQENLLHSGWYTTNELAHLLGVDTSTLRRWRTAQPPQGPPFVRLTNRVTMYGAPDVQTWLESRRIDPTQVG